MHPCGRWGHRCHTQPLRSRPASYCMIPSSFAQCLLGILCVHVANFSSHAVCRLLQRDAMVGIGVSLLALARCFSRIGCGCAVLRVLLSRARVKPGSRELPNDSGAGAYLILVSAVPWTPLSPLWGCSPALLDMLLFVAQVPYVAFLPDLLMASCCCLR